MLQKQKQGLKGVVSYLGVQRDGEFKLQAKKKIDQQCNPVQIHSEVRLTAFDDRVHETVSYISYNRAIH